MPIRADVIDKLLKDYQQQEDGGKKHFRRTFIIYSLAACTVFNLTKFFLFYGGLVFGVGIDLINLIIAIFSYTFIFPLLIASIFVKKYLGIVILIMSATIPFISILVSTYLHLSYNSNDLFFFFLKIVWLPFVIGLGLIFIDFDLFSFIGHKNDDSLPKTPGNEPSE